MASRARSQEDVLAPFVDRLYAAPLDGFTDMRKALVAELRARGAKDEAAALAAMKKPTRTAWALNHVARTEPKALASFVDATEKVRAAQASAIAKGSSAPLRDATRALNAAMATIIALAKRALENAGAGMTTAQHRIMTRSLHAIPFAAADEVARLKNGTLVVDLDAASDFGVFGAIPKSAPARAEDEPATKHDPRIARRAAAEEERAAREDARRIEAERKARARESKRLDAIATRAEEEAARLENESEVAARHARDLTVRAQHARTKADTARAAASRASEDLHRSAR